MLITIMAGVVAGCRSPLEGNKIKNNKLIAKEAVRIGTLKSPIWGNRSIIWNKN
ncbi:MAG: hypothetical protein ACKO2V_08480 [Snowella sp.]